jgi:hypothetical protein
MRNDCDIYRRFLPFFPFLFFLPPRFFFPLPTTAAPAGCAAAPFFLQLKKS